MVIAEVRTARSQIIANAGIILRVRIKHQRRYKISPDLTSLRLKAHECNRAESANNG